MLNHNHKVYLKVITPVHIGGAQEKHLQPGIDFIKKRGKIFRIKENELYETFDSHELANVFATGEPRMIENLISKDLKKVTEEIYSEFDDRNEIKANIRNGYGEVFIPGSSIKGAIRSSIYGYLHREYFPNVSESNKENFLFGDIRNDNDIFRLVKISDCSMKSTLIVPTKVFNLQNKNGNWIGGWKHSFRASTDQSFSNRGFTTGFECLQLNQVGEFTIKIASEFYEKNKNTLKFPDKGSKAIFSGDRSLIGIFTRINKHTKNHLKKDLKFFETYNQANYSLNIINTIKGLIAKCSSLDENSALLRMGSGSGFHSISGDWQFDKYEDLPKWNRESADRFGLSYSQKRDYVDRYQMFKSRRLAFLRAKNGYDFYPMGFVLLSMNELKDESQTVDSTAKASKQTKPPAEEVKDEIKEYQIRIKSSVSLKRGDFVDAECIQFQYPHVIFKVYVEGYERESFRVRYPGGMEVGKKAQLRIASLQGKKFNKNTQFTIGKLIE